MFLTLTTGSDTCMGRYLLQWSVYLLVISLFIAYLARLALAVAAPYLAVFRFVCLTALVANGLGQAHQSIWYR